VFIGALTKKDGCWVRDISCALISVRIIKINRETGSPAIRGDIRARLQLKIYRRAWRLSGDSDISRRCFMTNVKMCMLLVEAASVNESNVND